jgi:2-polyprenyl-6-methoxyphenol hydroxylase-like FAD-dependent oxidoreductase
VKRLFMDVSEKPPKRRAIVIGGSIAGLFVGAFLRQIGWQVDIYERSSIELIGRGVGIFATHLELLEALDKCGAGTVDIGVIVYKRITFDRSGKVIAEKPQLQIVDRSPEFPRNATLIYVAKLPARSERSGHAASAASGSIQQK